MQSVKFDRKDKKADYNAFKLVSGKNFKLVHDLGSSIAREMALMLNIAGYDDFMAEAGEYIEAKKDTKPLQKKYAKVIKKHHETNIALDKMLESEVEIDLELFPLEKIPINITGSFLNSIKSMLS